MSKSFKFKNNMYLDTKGIVHNKKLLSDILSENIKTICLLDKYFTTSPWTIDLSKFTCGILIINYHPDGTDENNTYIYSFVKLNSNGKIYVNLITSLNMNNNAAPSLTVNDTSITIKKANWGGFLRVFYLGI